MRNAEARTGATKRQPGRKNQYEKRELLTVSYSTGEEAHYSEAAVEDAVRSVREDDVLGPTGTEVGDGAEHADGGEAGDADHDDLGHGGAVP